MALFQAVILPIAGAIKGAMVKKSQTYKNRPRRQNRRRLSRNSISLLMGRGWVVNLNDANKEGCQKDKPSKISPAVAVAATTTTTTAVATATTTVATATTAAPVGTGLSLVDTDGATHPFDVL